MRDGARLTELHNRQAGEIVAAIVKPTLAAGGEFTDVFVLLESVVKHVKERLAEQRLGGIETVGRG